MLFADLDLRAGTAVSSLPVKSVSWVSSSLCPRSSPRPETRTVHPMLPRIVVVVVVASRRFRLPCSRSSWKKQSQTFGSIRVAWVVGIFTGLQLEPTCRCFCPRVLEHRRHMILDRQLHVIPSPENLCPARYSGRAHPILLL